MPVVFVLVLFLLVAIAAFGFKWQHASTTRLVVGQKRTRLLLHMMSSEERSDRPPIIPFDSSNFARDDILITYDKDEDDKQKKKKREEEEEAKKSRREEEPRLFGTGFIEDPNRPTGYGRPDVGDNEDEMRQKMLDDNWVPGQDRENDSAFVRWFKDTYIGTPYDSRKKQQARYVIVNITIISFSIGFIFTAIWFAFPNKFISFRGENRDFTARYDSSFVAPEGLLGDEFSGNIGNGGGDPLDLFFDKAEGLPVKEQTRFELPPPAAPLRLAPPPIRDL